MSKTEEEKAFEEEIQQNLIELQDLVQSIEMLPRNKDRPHVCCYEVRLFDDDFQNEKFTIEFKRGSGYWLIHPKKGEIHFESMQAVLSTLSLQYRLKFAQKISQKLSQN
jgi:hypothetical protein